MRRKRVWGGQRPWWWIGLGALPVALMALLLAAPAAANPPADLVISGGNEGGHYDAVAGRLRSLVVVEHGYAVDVRKSEGSIQNLERLADPKSAVSVGLTQTDALQRFLSQNPTFAEEYLVLADVGRECAFLVAGTRTPVKRLGGLANVGEHGLSVGPPGSGAAVTWQSMTDLVPELRDAPASHLPLMEALLQIKLGSAHSSMQAVMLVQRPQTLSPAMEIVLQNPEHFRFVPIRSGDLRPASLPSGAPVYTFEQEKLRYRGKPTPVETVCMRGLLIGAKSKLSDPIRSGVIQVLLANGDALTPGMRK